MMTIFLVYIHNHFHIFHLIFRCTCFTGSAGTCKGGGCTPKAQYWTEKFNFKIFDRVVVPGTLAAGEYMYALSFRWGAYGIHHV